VNSLISWGITLLLVALCLWAFFGGGTVPEFLAGTGKWLICVGVVLALIYAIFGTFRGRNAGPPSYY
jgi:uncharacterized membrane protein YtjA (UPF0391 family)